MLLRSPVGNGLNLQLLLLLLLQVQNPQALCPTSLVSVRWYR